MRASSLRHTLPEANAKHGFQYPSATWNLCLTNCGENRKKLAYKHEGRPRTVLFCVPFHLFWRGLSICVKPTTITSTLQVQRFERKCPYGSSMQWDTESCTWERQERSYRVSRRWSPWVSLLTDGPETQIPRIQCLCSQRAFLQC